jgi:hypothetical protein
MKCKHFLVRDVLNPCTTGTSIGVGVFCLLAVYSLCNISLNVHVMHTALMAFLSWFTCRALTGSACAVNKARWIYAYHS